ncbi:MAG: gliding motility-associated C-terminal domain-containing protein [Bacteroidota bacterium]|nr:gliding motility-associated C-terminal domain-containing protein [Bacteroidota bacterium]MDP4245995.1 gliding motility-associated C-terminal domain-containing protein [Bacteroidota bacterium]MDP4255136.1 gliding motility-associated C-terminal domain-containing protein [Bacteroidota bacterium]MDP4260392.1 gliding motility-associated C-terminal domain-containing protein [Bacteroidota bacterium]
MFKPLFLFSQPSACIDSAKITKYTSVSFTHELQVAQGSAGHTRDGGMVWWYGKRDTVAGSRSDSLLVFKTDAAGHLLWSTTIDETFAGYGYLWSEIGFPQMLEMSKGNLLFLAGAGTFSSFNGTIPDFTLLMLDGSGNRVWQKDYYGYSGGSLAEGDNGDILSFANGRFTRFDANGNVQAQFFYQPPVGMFTSEPAIACINHHVYLESLYNQRTFSGGNDWGIYLIKADYLSGNLLESRRYRLNSLVLPADTTSFGTTTFRVVHNQQSFVFTTNVFSPSGSQFEAIVLSVDTNLNIGRPGVDLIKPFYEHIPGVYFLDVLCGTNDSGVTACEFDDLLDRHISYYTEVDENEAILAQRRLQFADPQYQLASFPGAGNVIQQAMVSSQDQSTPYFLYVNSSPALIGGTGCSGIDTPFISASPFMPSTSPILFTQTNLSSLTQAPVNTQSSAIVINNTMACTQKSICDTLKINGPDTVCAGNTGIRFTATKNANCLRYIDWDADSSLVHIMARPDDTTVILSFGQSGRPYLHAYTRGCSASDSLPITILPFRDVHIGKDTSLCPGDSLMLNAGGGFLSYLWQDASTDSTFLAVKPGQYYIMTKDLCDHPSSDTMLVKFIDKGLSAGPDFELCAKEDGRLTATAGFTFYKWQPAGAILGDPDEQSITIRPPETTDFIVTAYDEGSCPLSDTVRVTVKDCLNKLLVPGAFTPNGDGNNDMLRPIVIGDLVKYEFAVYNRWGEKVFHSFKPEEGWDGRIGGKMQENDSFVWTCQYQFAGDKATSAKGVFLLIR